MPHNLNKTPKIIQYLNTQDMKSNSESKLPLETPLFEPIPPVIMFSDYEALKVQ